MVGFASAVDYIHPDKSQDLWINEVSVSHRKRGLAKQILGALLEVGRQLGCREAWVLTDRPNSAAMRLYESLGGKGTDHVMFTFKL
jgi:GNAT superfamily N-acetyltransferase